MDVDQDPMVWLKGSTRGGIPQTMVRGILMILNSTELFHPLLE